MGSRCRSLSYLEEEEELANFLVHCAEIDYVHSLSQFLPLVQRILDSKGIEKMLTTPGDGGRKFVKATESCVIVLQFHCQ